MIDFPADVIYMVKFTMNLGSSSYYLSFSLSDHVGE